MIKLRQAIVVEGRYDKNALCQLVDAPVIETHGFGVMHDKALLSLLRRAAQTTGLIIFTDSDGAGFVIRNFLKGALPPEQVLHAYIPDVPGKERRKRAPGKEGKLGVEGIDDSVLTALFDQLQVHYTTQLPKDPITSYDLYAAGLAGTPDSKQKKKKLLAALDLPEFLSTSALLVYLNSRMQRDEFLTYVDTI